MDALSAFLPDGVSPLVVGVVVVASAGTAGLTAALGLGGGLVLLAVMSALLPAPAVIPVHGVAQLSSNASRFALHARATAWRPTLWFLGGAILGALAGGRVAVTLPSWVLQSAVGLFVLYSQWGRIPSVRGVEGRTFAVVGVVGTFLTMFFGATGPFVASALSGLKLDRLTYTATHAATMVIQHGLKVVAFGFLGFAFSDWGALIAAIVAATVIGSYVGSHFLKRTSDGRFETGLKWVLTVLGANLLLQAALSAFAG
ncbi:MAG: sulfite exporter TauE/SafE family protein [Pseudomonadota bacterium]